MTTDLRHTGNLWVTFTLFCRRCYYFRGILLFELMSGAKGSGATNSDIFI